MDPIAAAAYGMFQATRKFEASSFRVAQQGADADLVSETVTQITARSEFSANVQVMKTADEMVGDLLDIIA